MPSPASDAGVKSQRPCILCGRPTNSRGLYVPGDGGESIGAPDGKTRLVIYPICQRCSMLPGGAEMVEAAIHAKLGDIAYFLRDRRVEQ